GHSHAHTHSHSHGDSDSYVHAYTDGHGYSNSHGYSYAYSNSHAHAAAYTDAEASPYPGATSVTYKKNGVRARSQRVSNLQNHRSRSRRESSRRGSYDIDEARQGKRAGASESIKPMLTHIRKESQTRQAWKTVPGGNRN